MDKKIATHNSCASWKESKGLWDRLLIPFAGCQTKSLEEQLAAGVRFFDLRIRKEEIFVPLYEYRICHGLWRSSRTLESAIKLFEQQKDDVYMEVFYEGSLNERERRQVVETIDTCRSMTKKNVHIVLVGVKKPEWEVLKQYEDIGEVRSQFVKITGWKKLLPIPWLWDKLVKKEYSEDAWTMVDFV